MDPVETYLTELRDIRSSGAAVQETSYYGPLANLLNAVGKHLKPRVRCIINIRNKGAGLPDGGFFSSDQFQRASALEPLVGQLPSRGTIEVKGTSDDAFKIAEDKQVSRYLAKYRQVLVTNFRDFILIGQDASGKRINLESYRLAESEADFWRSTAAPHIMAAEHKDRFVEYLKRVMLHATPLASPEDVAWFLASYARDAKLRIEQIKLPHCQVFEQLLSKPWG